MAAEPEKGSPPAADARSFGIASIGRHAVLYAIGQILSKAVAFLMLPIYTSYLSPADYGVAALIEMTLDVIAIVAGAQIAQGVYRFYHKADTPEEKRRVVSTTMTAMAVSFGIMGAAVYLFAAPLSRLVFKSDAHADLLHLAAISFALQSLMLVPTAFARVQERSGLVVGSTLLKLVVQVGLNVTFIVGMGLGVKGVFLSTLFSNLVIGLWLGWWAVRQVGLGIDPAILRSLIRYGVPLIGVQAATFTMTFSDRYFLQAAGGEAAVGLYNLAYQFGFLLLMLGFVPIEMIWGPRRFQVARGPNPSPVLAKAFRLINVSMFTIGVGIALFVGDLLRIMSKPPFHPAAAVVPIILIAYVFHG
ncbi:MAG: lipopolysaccharide biosynthesis protein, partial [Gemmatimonadaceae bacterium]